MNRSGQNTFLRDVRAIGHRGPDGRTYGSCYYPAHEKNGKLVQARTEFRVAINNPPYNDANGQKVDVKMDVVKVVVWNGKNAASGKGLADIFAKCVSVGKLLSFDNLRINTYEKRLFSQGQPVLNPATGQPIMVEAISYVLDGSFGFGEDSSKLVDAEIAAFTPGYANFHSRPKHWNIQGHPDNEAWKMISKIRMAQVWDGRSKEYGYARVMDLPQNAQVPQTQHMPQMGAAPTQAAAILNQPMSMQPGFPQPDTINTNHYENMASQPVNQQYQFNTGNPTQPAQNFAGANNGMMYNSNSMPL